MSNDADDARPVDSIPFDDLPSSSLYRDYMARFDRVQSFYGRDWTSADDRRSAVEAAAARHLDRDTLVAVLREQQGHWGPDAHASDQLSRLLDPRSVAVVTGQQVGLFTGALYTVLKAMTTVRLARELERETGHPVVPVFWLGSEDHDLDEMAVAAMPAGDEVETLRYEGHALPESGNLGSVGRLEFTDDVARLVDRAAELLPTTDFHGPLVAALRDAYAPGTSFRDAFARLLRVLLPDSGLVLMAADDTRLKRLALPLWRREVTDGTALHEALADTAAQVGKAYHVQVRTSPTNLFVAHGDARLPLDLENGAYRIRGTDAVLDRDELLRLLDRETGRFTPNVVLRPLTQDWLLPTAAYVGGPGEVAYFAQFRPAYEWAGLPMPVIHPRTSVTLVEPRIRRLLDRLGLPVTAFSGDVEALFSRVIVEQLGVDLDGRFDEARSAVEAAMEVLAVPIEHVDATLGKTVEAARSAMAREIDRLRERVVRSERRRHDELRSQVFRVATSLYPDRTPQERVIGPLYFAAKFGPAFFPDLMERLDVFSRGHLVIDC